MLNYTELAGEIIADLARKVPDFSHLEPDKIAVAAAGRWAGTSKGNLAHCIGLRNENKPTFSVWTRRGTKTVTQVTPWFRQPSVEVCFHGVRCRYLILLHLPRFFTDDPLETLVHELYHVSEKFDGLLRNVRHGKRFDGRVRRLKQDWLERADPQLAELARMRLREIRNRFGSIVARSLPWNFQNVITIPTPAPCSYEEGLNKFYPGYHLAANYRVKPIKYSPPSVPRRITDKECDARVYHARGVERLAPAYARYLAARKTR